MRRRWRIVRIREELLAYATAISGDDDLAQDLVQEAICRTLKSDAAPARLEDLRPWMLRVIRNLHADLRRRDRTRLEYAADLKRLFDDAGPSRRDPVDAILLRQAVARLGAAHREIVYLVDVMGMTYAEAAAVLDIPRGTVMSRISRARRALLAEVEATNVRPLRRAE